MLIRVRDLPAPVHQQAPFMIAVVDVLELIEPDDGDDDAAGADQPRPGGPVKDRGDEALLLALTARLVGKQHLRGGDDDRAVCDRAHGYTDPFGHAFWSFTEPVWIENRLEDEPNDVAARPKSDGSDQSTAERKLQDSVEDALLFGCRIRNTQEREHRPNANEHVQSAD